MATINIKQNSINFTVDNTNTPVSYTPVAGATFSPSDLGTNFDLNMLKSAETEGWLNDLRVLHSLFIDWDNGQITLNGTQYTISNTGQLLAAIQNANKTYGLGNYSGKLSTQAFTNKYNELLNRINNLPIPSTKNDIIISGKSITGLSNGYYLNYGSTATITFTTSVPCTVQLVPEYNARYDQSVTTTGSYTHKIAITNTNTTDFEYQVEPNWIVIKVADSYVDASQYNVENGYAYLSDGTHRGTQYGIGYDIYMQPEQQYPVYYYDAEVGGIKLNEDPQYVKMGQVITLWSAYGEDENYRFIGWKNKSTNTIYPAGSRLTIKSAMISGSSISFYAVYEEIISYTYVEPEPEEINDAYVSFDGYDTISGSFTGGSVSEGRTITLPSAGKNSTAQYSYIFNGWKNESTNTVYSAGSTITIWSDTNFTAQFIGNTRQYNVTLNVNNGVITEGAKTKVVDYGQTASWYIAPNDGYQLPTIVDKGTISGNKVTSNIVRSSFTVYATCPEAPISYTYVEPEPEEINDAYVSFDGYDTISGSFTGGSVSEGRTITLPSAGKNSTAQYSYIFNGWKNESTNTVYSAGSTITIWSDTNFTAQFIGNIRQYNVTCTVHDGIVTSAGGPTQSIEYGQIARFTIAPNAGYQLPTSSFAYGHMEGNVVVSDIITEATTIHVRCPEEPIAYVEPEYVFSIDDNYDTIAWNGTKTVTATLTNGSASNTKWTLSGDTQYATLSSSTGSSTKVTANNTAINSQSLYIDDPTITYSDGYLNCIPSRETITTYGANKSVILKATNSNATSGSPQSCIINIQAKPESSITVDWSSIDWYIVSGSEYASLSNNGTTTCRVTNNNYSGSTQVIKVRCVVYYGSSGSKSKDYTFNVPNIEVETSYTYVG